MLTVGLLLGYTAEWALLLRRPLSGALPRCRAGASSPILCAFFSVLDNLREEGANAHFTDGEAEDQGGAVTCPIDALASKLTMPQLLEATCVWSQA